MAAKILAQVNEINVKTMAYKGLLAGKLKISVVSTGKYVIPYFLVDFMRTNPGVELAIDVTNKLKVLESLEHNEVDLALVSILPLHPQIEKMDLLQNKLYFVGNMERKFHRSETFKDLIQSVPMIYRESGSGTRQVMERYIEKNKFTISKKMELTSNEAVKQALVAGLGYSVMPLIGIKNELFNKELQIIPAKGLPIKTTWSLIWLKGKRHSPVSMAFLNYIKVHKSQIVQEKFSWYEQY
jgi:DNA-binding transcriptional LysR family regulator